MLVHPESSTNIGIHIGMESIRGPAVRTFFSANNQANASTTKGDTTPGMRLWNAQLK
jgi:hypothetical protein